MGADIRLAGVLPHCSVSGNARILPHDIPGLIRGVLIMVPAVSFKWYNISSFLYGMPQSVHLPPETGPSHRGHFSPIISIPPSLPGTASGICLNLWASASIVLNLRTTHKLT